MIYPRLSTALFLSAGLTLGVSAAPALNATQVDYVIVGGGTAGLTLAARLSERAGITVTVIEAGVDGRTNVNVTDLKNRYKAQGGALDWTPLTVPQRAANGRQYQQTQGKVLGGSSAINGAAWVQPDKREYAAWESLGATGWSFNTISAASKKSETFHAASTGELKGNPSYHGRNGPIQVSVQNNINPFWDDVVLPTLRAANHSVVNDPTGGVQGASYTQISTYPNTTLRSYAANAYYTPAENRTNLELLLNSHVSKIIWNEKKTANGRLKAQGVEYIDAEGNIKTVNAKNVIISAGALHSPKVLELSGVGDPAVLKPLNISVKFANPAVGNNLQNQIGVSVIFNLKNVTSYQEAQQPIMDQAPATVVLDAAGKIEQAAILANKSADIPQKQFDILKKFINEGVAQTEVFWSTGATTNGSTPLTLYTTDLHTFSRGSVHINSTDALVAPLYDPNYLSAEHDLWYLAKAITHSRKLTQTAPLSSYVVSETAPGANYTTDAQVREWLKSNFRTMSHFVGTAAALPLKEGGVVDPQNFKVHGTENVRVIDASVVPLLPGIHTESIVYAIAEWAATKLN